MEKKSSNKKVSANAMTVNPMLAAANEVAANEGLAPRHVSRTLARDSVQPVRRRRAKLKLFVWTDFSPDYTSGLAFAIAKDETEAKKLIIKDRGYDVYTWGDLKIHPLSKKIAESVSGGG